METNSQTLRREWAEADKRQACKQCCTKIEQGLDKLDNRSAERAIWELFQNARDLATNNSKGEKEAHIKITVTPTEFIFSHQGRPFTHDSFSSLVKQISAQEKEDDDSVGQYGTGFLTTHSFGRRILVNGSLELGDNAPGKYIDINNFEIDRVFDDIPQFISKMTSQLIAIDQFLDAPWTEECRKWTELHYQLDSADKADEKVRNGIEAAIKVMPYVMTVNKPIGDVEIEDKTTGRTTKFSKQNLPAENGLNVTGITIDNNGETLMKKIYYLQSPDENDIAILPLKEATKAESLNGIAKLFVFFPLLGTEEFGMDVIFHSKRFFPVEARDALHLPVDNANVKAKYEANVTVLNEMSDMVFAYMTEHADQINDWVNVSRLSFECIRNKEDLTNDFFKNFKHKWVHFFEQLPIIDIDGTRETVAGGNVNIYSAELVGSITGDNQKWEDALYSAASVYGHIPAQEQIIDWSTIVASWYGNDSACFLSFEKLSAKLGEEDVDFDILLNFDQFISAIGRNQLFESYSLIPNRDGKLKRKSELCNAETIPNWVCNLVRAFVPNEVSKFVDFQFTGIDTFPSYTRNNLKSQLNDSLSIIAKDTIRKSVNPSSCKRDILINMANICLITKSRSIENYRTKAMRVICDHLGMQYSLQELAPLDQDERDLAELPFKHLVENILLEISSQDSEWITANYNYVYSIHETLSTWSEYYSKDSKDGYAKKYGAFLNMLNKPSLVNELKKGINIPSELMELYKSIIGTDLKEQLVNPDFATFCEFPTIDACAVAKEIEEKLGEKEYQNDLVLDIIDMIDQDNQWSAWFPRITEKKADIFMKQVKPECKDSVYRLMKIDDADKLRQLAALAEDCDMDEILRLGKEAAIRKQNEKAAFEYKKGLGKYVEDFIETGIKKMLEGKLNHSNVKINVVNEQCGHDLVVYANDVPVYYLEIKSRWSTDQSVEMSQLQLHSCVANADCFALCCVNMAGVNQYDVKEHIYPNVKDTIDRIKCLPNIGDLSRDIESATVHEDDKIHIGGSYSCIVPQQVIQREGLPFHELLTLIAKKCIRLL